MTRHTPRRSPKPRPKLSPARARPKARQPPSGPRTVFFILAGTALAGLAVARRLPSRDAPAPLPARSRPRWPDALDTWSFLEGFTLDGLFVIGLSFLGGALFPGGAVLAAAVVLALRYAGEIVLSPLGGRMAERWGAERLLMSMSLLTGIALVGFGAGWVWSCAASIVVLRALQLPLLAPIVAHRHPGPGRIRALAARSIWRDIGAGTGPLVAGIMLPIVSPTWLYGVAALLLALAALACGRNAAARA